jgi:hypothetical protein
MIKTSSRRKLAVSLMGLGRALRTPVSKLTNKQKALGTLGTLGGIAAGKHFLEPHLDDFLMKKFISKVQGLDEVKNYADSLGRPVTPNTKSFLDHTLSGANSHNLALTDIENKALAEVARRKADILRNIETGHPGILKDVNYLNTAKGNISAAEARARLGAASMLMAKSYLDTSATAGTKLKSLVPVYGDYIGFLDGMSGVAKQEALRTNPEISKYLDSVVRSEIGTPFYSRLQALEDAVQGNLRLVESAPGQVDSAAGAIKSYRPERATGVEELKKLVGSLKPVDANNPTAYILPKSTSINLVDLERSLGSPSRMQDSLAELMNFEGRAVSETDKVKQILEDIKRIKSPGAEINNLIRSSEIEKVVQTAKERLRAWSEYTDKANLDDVYKLNSRDFGKPTNTSTAVSDILSDQVTDKVKDEVTDRLAKRVAVKAGVGAAGAPVKAALTVGTTAGDYINRYARGGESNLARLAEQLGYNVKGMTNQQASELLNSIAEARAKQLAEIYGAELLGKVKNIGK